MMNKIKNRNVTPEGVQLCSLGNTVRYVLLETRTCSPALLGWCLVQVAALVLRPVLTMFLPSTVVAQLTAHAPAGKVLGTVLLFTLPLALLDAIHSWAQEGKELGKAQMGSHYLCQVASKGLRTDYCNLENEAFGRLQQSAVQACSGFASAARVVYDAFVQIGANALGFVVYLAILSRLSLWVVGFILLAALADHFLDKMALRWRGRQEAALADHQRRLAYLDRKLGDPRPAKDIRLYGMRAWLDALYQNALADTHRFHRQKHKTILHKEAIKCLLWALREGLVYAWLLTLALRGRLSAAEFVLYFGAVSGFSNWLLTLLAQLELLGQCNVAFSSLRRYLDYPESYRHSEGLPTDALRQVPCALTLQKVSYRYPGAGQDTLHDLDLTLAPGEHLAVLGVNGAGKSTLARLLCGLGDPTAGRILYNGVDVRQYDRNAYYELFSVVFQDMSLLPVSVAEAVAETPADVLDDARVQRCLQAAGLWQDICALPDGVRTPIDQSIYENGAQFSGGQVQKLALARALYKDAPVLILDEPTAALDPIAESRVYQLYDRLLQGRTAVFISHRLASTRFCDRILLLGDGGILEMGTHDQLMAQKGLYQRMFEAQAQYYREGGPLPKEEGERRDV